MTTTVTVTPAHHGRARARCYIVKADNVSVHAYPDDTPPQVMLMNTGYDGELKAEDLPGMIACLTACLEQGLLT